MNPDVVIPVVGGFLGAVLVFLGAWNTARVAKFSNERTTRLEEFRSQLTARDDLIKGYKEDLRSVNERVDMLTSRFDALQNYERMLFWWARAVYPILQASGVPFPKAPPGVSDTNPGLPRVHE